jgi:hypothetical protein
MQTSQVRKQFSDIEQCVDRAARACQLADGATPEPLRSCLNRLESESDQAKQALQKESNDSEILDWIDRLEELGDQAVEACKQGEYIDPRVKDAVARAHDAISSLKQRLH